jgi:raffinose/stachyose/melibiose transport system permease protein
MQRTSMGADTPSVLAGAKRARRTRSINRSWTNYLYILPLFVFILGFVYFAIGYTIYVSFLDWNGFSRRREFIGLENFAEMFDDRIILRALKNTALFGILAIVMQMLLGFLLAVLLKTRIRFKTVYKTIFFLPVVLAPAVISYIFRHIYQAEGGPLNTFLESIGLGALQQAWLADPSFALYALTLINIWQWTGFSFLLYFAALTLIDEHLYEAARIDGASFMQVLRYITFPLLKSTHLTLVILGFIGALKTFDIVYLTTGGGPGRATEFMSTYIFKEAILEYNAGYSAALALLVVVLCITSTAIQLYLYRNQ